MKQYFLINDEKIKKLGKILKNPLVSFISIKYVEGINHTNNDINILNKNLEIILHSNGINFEFRKGFKTYNLAISNNEIKEMIHNIEDKIFEIYLKDENLIKLKYKNKEDVSGLLYLTI
jgi:hypothetical protein